MSDLVIEAPSARLVVSDLGAVRRIVPAGRGWRYGRFGPLTKPVETVLRAETVAALVEIKGDFWLDELDRRHDPVYVRRRLESLFDRFGGVAGAGVLDIGSGSGSSALILLDCGARHVQGVEPDGRLARLARLRAQDEGRSGQASFLQTDDTARLPFPAGSFQVATFNAVVEHIPPSLRAPILREAWRLLAPGGRLVITETPNRCVPYDAHTTRLPLVPWLPLPAAAWLARRWSRSAPRGRSTDEYVSAGIVGGQYDAIRRALPGARCLNLEGGDAAWKCGLKGAGPATRAALGALESGLRVVGWPLAAVMPTLDLVFRKQD